MKWESPSKNYLDAYRYGFNGKEMDDDVKGNGNQYDYGFRIYDPRIGRFLSVDPLQKEYPELTSYQFSHNAPIDGVDLDGRERMDMRLLKNDDGTCKLQIVSSGPETKRYSSSFWRVTKIPPLIRLEYNGQHYIFADARNRGKMPSQEVFTTPIYYMKDFNDFIANPDPDSYVSEEEGWDDFKSELFARAVVGMAEETSNRAVGKMSNRIQWRGRYTNKSTDQQQASANGGSTTKQQGAIVKPPTVSVDGVEKNLYRGGSDFTISDKDIKIDPQTGLIKTTHGISINANSDKMSKFGGAFKIVSLPKELQIIQRGKKDKNHFEIVPKQQMSKEEFQKYLNQIKTENVHTTVTNGG